MKALRTPDERFFQLESFPFTPHHVEIDDGEGGTLWVHHLDEGPDDGPVVLLMHGEPIVELPLPPRHPAPWSRPAAG